MGRPKHLEMNLAGGLAALGEMFAYSRSEEEPDLVIRSFLKACLAIFPADGAALFLGGPPLSKFSLTRHRVERPSGRLARTAVPDPGDLVETVLREARPATLYVPRDRTAFDPARDGVPGVSNPTRVLLVPLENTPPAIGCLILVSEEDMPDPEAALADLTRLVSIGLQALEQQSSFERLRTLSTTDDLTGVYNYRYLLDSLRREIKRAGRFQQVFSFLMVDIDHLKEYNDLHGHLAGSRLLTAFSGIVQAQLRAVDTLAKYGGDEFGIILPQTDKKGARIVAERIRASIESHRFSGEVRKITASAGLSSYPEDGKEVETLLGRADEALYRAKNSGRNRTCAVGDE